ncbi:MAG: DUF421 domain-containing protein [Clostridia bacterium]|nr:DUF421 domain-containing protein [Clostridia bacterium]
MELIKVALSALFSAIALFIIAKILGHKQMSALDFFDYITGITIGSIAAEMATEIEKPLKPLIAMAIYGVITVLLTTITSKFPKTRKYINGTPTIIMDNGKLYRKNMKKAKIDLSEFMVMCRKEGYFNLNDIQTAIFEYNGQLTVLPKSAKRPLNASDINIETEPEFIFTEIIMEGKLLKENLKRSGLDTTWLQKQLEIQGYKSYKEILLGVVDENNELSVFADG